MLHTCSADLLPHCRLRHVLRGRNSVSHRALLKARLQHVQGTAFSLLEVLDGPCALRTAAQRESLAQEIPSFEDGYLEAAYRFPAS